jgi:protein-S-isoprenylcysteine O-methyltransferase Ste14
MANEVKKRKEGKDLAAENWTKENILWSTIMTVLAIVCFPANPLVLTGVVETGFYPVLFAVGWAVWAFGMVLVMAPIIMFPRRGGVQKGKAFVSTTRLVDTGVYSVVRHPQYLGGILAIFVTTLLWYPYWLFAVLGLIGAAVVYVGAREEDKRLVQKFGDDYVRYMQKVPRMNILAGIVRRLRRPKGE